MAEVIWTEAALSDLEAIAEYIAIDKPAAASRLVARIMAHVEQLKNFSEMGSLLPELRDSRYRQLSEPPCRVVYRSDGSHVYILMVMRAQRLIRPEMLLEREPEK